MTTKIVRSDRSNSDLRKVTIEPNFYAHADGSCLISVGKTKVVCVATLEDRVPLFLRNSGRGWLSAEYGMLPGSCSTRVEREAVKGRQSPRSSEIQRLIGRSLRAALNFKALGEKQIKIDCDVLVADGGTRTASITGGYVALALAVSKALKARTLKQNPIIHQVAAVSCGVVDEEVRLDLDYQEDSKAQSDGNFVMNETGGLIEVQASAEGAIISPQQLTEMLTLAEGGIKHILALQQEALTSAVVADLQSVIG